jgi:hypothetical protein
MIAEPTNLLIPIIVVAAIFMIVGVLFGLLIAGMKNPENGKKNAQGDKQRRLTPLVQLWRDQQTQLLVLEIDGEKYFTRSEMRRGLIEALEKVSLELRIWLGVSKVAELNRLSSERTEAPAAVISPVSIKPVNPLPSQPEVQPISTDMTAVLSSAVSSVLRKPETARPATMAAQINEILQQKLLNSTLSRLDIRVMDDPEGGVLVAVGDERFNSVSDVTDPQIQALLRECVAEWEKRY